jgi:NAD(P)-dependent dehydrogenase (short-subunit alcohol dehydrogenase family)
MLSFDFTGKSAVVTGGGQGIGRAIAAALLKAGASVFLAECDAEAGSESCAELAGLGPVVFVPTDIADPGAVETLRQRVAASGGLDLLVNNAAVMVRKPLEELTPAEWQRVLDVNLTGPFLCSRAFAPLLRARRGSIVNIASTRALMSEPHTESYAAAKGGLVALTHALALSLGPEVRVNCISPGWIDVTALARRSRREPARLSPHDHIQHPVGRVGRPEDIAAMVLYLASAAAGFITGENIVIDGGMTRKMIYVEEERAAGRAHFFSVTSPRCTLGPAIVD